MRYYNRAGAEVNPIESLEKAILKLEKYDPARTKTEIAKPLSCRPTQAGFWCDRRGCSHAIRSWHRMLANVYAPREPAT